MDDEGLLGQGNSFNSRRGLGDEYLDSSDRCARHLYEVVKKPRVLLRFVSLIFSIVVTSCISGHGWSGKQCMLNSGSGACNYATSISVLAACGLTLFLLVDFALDLIVHDSLLRRLVIIADMFFFGLWACVWLSCFCYLTDAWRHTTITTKTPGGVKSAIRAAIVFSFFSILSFVILGLMAYRRYRDYGTDDDYTLRFITAPRTMFNPPPTLQHTTYSSLPSSTDTGLLPPTSSPSSSSSPAPQSSSSLLAGPSQTQQAPFTYSSLASTGAPPPLP